MRNTTAILTAALTVGGLSMGVIAQDNTQGSTMQPNTAYEAGRSMSLDHGLVKARIAELVRTSTNPQQFATLTTLLTPQDRQRLGNIETTSEFEQSLQRLNEAWQDKYGQPLTIDNPTELFGDEFIRFSSDAQTASMRQSPSNQSTQNGASMDASSMDGSDRQPSDRSVDHQGSTPEASMQRPQSADDAGGTLSASENPINDRFSNNKDRDLKNPIDPRTIPEGDRPDMASRDLDRAGDRQEDNAGTAMNGVDREGRSVSQSGGNARSDSSAAGLKYQPHPNDGATAQSGISMREGAADPLNVNEPGRQTVDARDIKPSVRVVDGSVDSDLPLQGQATSEPTAPAAGSDYDRAQTASARQSADGNATRQDASETASDRTDRASLDDDRDVFTRNDLRFDGLRHDPDNPINARVPNNKDRPLKYPIDPRTIPDGNRTVVGDTRGTTPTADSMQTDASTSVESNRAAGENAAQGQYAQQRDRSMPGNTGAHSSAERSAEQSARQSGGIYDQAQTAGSVQPADRSINQRQTGDQLTGDQQTGDQSRFDRNDQSGKTVTAVIPASNGLPRLDLKFVAAPAAGNNTANAATDRTDSNLLLDIPDSVSANSLTTSLTQHINQLVSSVDQWPTEQQQAQRIVAHHLLAAMHGQ